MALLIPAYSLFYTMLGDTTVELVLVMKTDEYPMAWTLILIHSNHPPQFHSPSSPTSAV